jgi:stalled ribosome rescue protein Dom34
MELKNMEIEHAFEKLAESNYDVKLGLTISDKESGVTITSSIDKDKLKDWQDEFSKFVDATIREADNECMERKIDKMKKFKADFDIMVDGPTAAARKVVERLKEEGAKIAYVSLELSSTFDSLEGFEFPKDCKDSCEQRIAREIGTIDGIKLFYYGNLVWNDTTVLYE